MIAAIAIMVLFVIQVPLSSVPLGVPASSSAPSAATTTAGLASHPDAVVSPAAPAASPGFAGQSPAGEARANPAVTDQRILENQSQRVFPVNPNAPVTAQTPPRDAGISAVASVPAIPHLVPALAPSIPTGYITGTVVDSRAPHSPIAGATVVANPLSGFCPTGGCVSNETSSTGQFTVTAATGENVIIIQDGYYMTNRTWAYVSLDIAVSAGTIELQHDAFVTGVVLSDDPTHEPVAGIEILASTRDGTFQVFPVSHTDPQGQFTAAVPPVASELQFTSVFPYSVFESNYTFVNVSAGTTLNIGTVYLERMTTISVTLVDSTTGQPIGGPASLQVSSKATGYNPSQSAVQLGPTVTAFAPVGPDSVIVYEPGYLVDATNLGVVPPTAPGALPVFMRTIALVPLGEIDLTVGIQGIEQPYTSHQPTATWPVGEAVVSICSLDNLDTAAVVGFNFTSTDCTGGCDPFVGDEVTAGALPLRNYINVRPDTAGACAFDPTWPIPGDMPVFSNYAWVNVTPDAITNAGLLDLLPGTYIEGQVFPTSVTGWVVEACSTDEPAICGPGAYSDAGYANDFANFPPQGCPTTTDPTAKYTFCVAVPPGPDILRVTPSNSSQNFTWATDPPFDWSSIPLPLVTASAAGVQSINLTSAYVTGRVLQALTRTPVAGLPAIEICPAGTAPGAVACGSAAANTTGFFNSSAPPGWDQVSVSAPGFLQNSTWLYVGTHNSSGTILVTPLGNMGGQVVNPQGAGILDSLVQSCPVVDPTDCSPVGADGGLSSTNGFYFGSVPAGSLPYGAYQVIATAPGYVTDWTWVNVTTPGQNFTVPNIVLRPLPPPPGQPYSGGPAELGSAGGGPAPGSWVTGRVIDAVYGIGLPDAAVSATSLAGGPPDALASVRGTGGEFNDSLPVGSYELAVTLPGYTPAYVAFNVTGNSTTVYLGTIELLPLPMISGRVVIDPWRTNITDRLGLGPGPATVTVCTNLATLCAPAGTADSSGFFNVSAPIGNYDVINVQGTGTGPGTWPGGFVSNSSDVNVTASGLEPGPALVVGMDIFGIITGTMVASGSGGTEPVRFEIVTADADTPVDATQSVAVNATGQYAVVFPEALILNMTGGGIGAWIPENHSYSVTGTLNASQPLVLSNGALLDLDVLNGGPSLTLEHFGYVDAKVIIAGTHHPVPYASVSLSEPGVLWGLPTSWASSGEANAYGFINVTAPPSIPKGSPVSVNISAPDFSYSSANVTVNTSATTYLNGTSASNLRGFALDPWGWVSGDVSDALTGAPLQGVSSVVSNGAGQSGLSSTDTNGVGYFFVDAPIGATDRLSLNLDGYSSNASDHNITSGARVSVPPVRLTGDGIVEGRIVSFPGGAVVSGASISVCPKTQPTCSNTVTSNASGVFAASATPGVDVITVSAAGFVTSSSNFVTASSDEWTWVGTLTIAEFAEFTGNVVGLPNGGPLVGGNASLCDPLPSGAAGPCFSTVTTVAGGAFVIPAPAGTYVLQISAPSYNVSDLAVSASAGEVVPVGTVFVQEFGSVAGVVQSIDGDVLAGATVTACQSWGNGSCLPTITTGVDGQYVIGGAAGPYVLLANAAGYQTAYATTRLVSGTTTAMPPLVLTLIGPNTNYLVSGLVETSGSSPQPLPGAVVTATGGLSATANGVGAFSMVLPWGTYTLTARLDGYLPASVGVVVHGTDSGVEFGLTLAEYVVQGMVHDGLTGAPLAGVGFFDNGTSLGASTSSGAYSFNLPNGTFPIIAESSPGTVTYASTPFVVAINGAGQEHNISLYPASVLIEGLVANSLTGIPIPGASVTVAGMTQEGVAWVVHVITGPDGRFTATAYPGNYTVRATLNGYAASSMSIVVLYSTSAATYPVTLAMSPASSPAPANTAPPSELLWVGVAAVILAGAAALLFFIQRDAVARRKARPRSPGGGK
jgi:hypothetical protein